MSHTFFTIPSDQIPHLDVRPAGPARLRSTWTMPNGDTVTIEAGDMETEGMGVALRHGALAAVERRCVRCQGYGGVLDDDLGDGICPDCNGHGVARNLEVVR